MKKGADLTNGIYITKVYLKAQSYLGGRCPNHNGVECFYKMLALMNICYIRTIKLLVTLSLVDIHLSMLYHV